MIDMTRATFNSRPKPTRSIQVRPYTLVPSAQKVKSKNGFGEWYLVSGEWWSGEWWSGGMSGIAATFTVSSRPQRGIRLKKLCAPPRPLWLCVEVLSFCLIFAFCVLRFEFILKP
jgi:hypothetical protein